MEVSVEYDKFSGKMLCGLIKYLPHGVDFLIGNDLQKEMPLHVSLVTRARIYTTDRNAVVTPNTDTNDSRNSVHFHPTTRTLVMCTILYSMLESLTIVALLMT